MPSSTVAPAAVPAHRQFGDFLELAHAVVTSPAAEALMDCLQQRLDEALKGVGLEPEAWTRMPAKAMTRGVGVKCWQLVRDELSAYPFDVELECLLAPNILDEFTLRLVVKATPRDQPQNVMQEHVLFQKWPALTSLSNFYKLAQDEMTRRHKAVGDQTFLSLAHALSVARMP